MRPVISSASIGLAIAAATAGLAGCGPATYGTGRAPEMALFTEVTGGLLGGDKKKPIEYQPRAPLVMPPSTESLPPPAETASTETNPQWPVDPDATTGTSGGPTPYDENPEHEISQAEYRRLKPLTGAFRQGRGGQTQAAVQDDMHDEARDVVHSRKQREEFAKALAETEGYGSTGQRRYLTDPPTAYREPAPTAPTEFKDVKKKRSFFLTRWLTGGS